MQAITAIKKLKKESVSSIAVDVLVAACLDAYDKAKNAGYQLNQEEQELYNEMKSFSFLTSATRTTRYKYN